MKKVLLLILCLLLILTGCNKQPDTEGDIVFRSGIYPSKFWETDRIENSQYCIIPDMDTAVRVATEIYKGISMSPQMRAYTAQSVFYDEEDEVWIVLFRDELPASGPIATGPFYSIALQRKDGKVLSIRLG